MRIFRHYRDVPDDCRGGVITLGNFDGFHRGHQAVLGEAAKIAAGRRLPLAVLTTEPHPRSFFAPAAPPFRLTPLRAKAGYFEAFGVDNLFVLAFDRTLAAMPAQDFVVDVLLGALGAVELVVGYDYRFGQGRGGGPDVLRWMAEMEGFGVTIAGPAGKGGEIYSSTLVRDRLRAGQPLAAAEILGHWWAIEGRVIEGERRGRTIGFATANILPEDHLQPRFGVYATRVHVGDGAHAGCYPGVANFGRRPTVDGEGVVLEAHLLDFSGDLYGAHVRVELLEFIRPERRFDGLGSLKQQIGRDADRARAILADPAHAADRFGFPSRHRSPD